MKVTINDSVGFSESEVLKLAISLIENRPPKDGSFNFGLESHGTFGITVGINLPYPVVVRQSNKRKTAKSPIIIQIEKDML